MPITKIPFTPGINRDITSYAAEGGWYECDKVRFRQGLPEKIGGWQQTSGYSYLGVCRSIHPWVANNGEQLRAFGTHKKMYVEKGGKYYDVTPIRLTQAATFSASDGSPNITVTSTSHEALVGNYIVFSGAVSLGGAITADVLNQEYEIIDVPTVDTFTIVAREATTDIHTPGAAVDANASDTGNGGGSVVAEFLLDIGSTINVPISGWGVNTWGAGTWGIGEESTEALRVWTMDNFGQDLIFGHAGGAMYIWEASGGFITATTTARATLLSDEPGATDVPTTQNLLMVTEQRFVFAFGANELGGSVGDNLLVRWSDQEDATNWTPAATNQAGGYKLSRGSKIIAAVQARQEVLVWTDTTLYSFQYVGYPEVWSTQVVAENISIANDRAVVYTAANAYWIGDGVFYQYDGVASVMQCPLRKEIFEDVNVAQYKQIFSGLNTEFSEAWWFYCSEGSTLVDKYVIYNFSEGVWYYGYMARTAWSDYAWGGKPVAATYNERAVVHEHGVDDNETLDNTPIPAYVTSAAFDLDDGDRFAFVRRVIPDVDFSGSTVDDPTVFMTLMPLRASGSGYRSPLSVGGESTRPIVRSATVPIEEYTEQVQIRVRGRQLVLKLESTGAGVQWHMGLQRLDMRPDGRK